MKDHPNGFMFFIGQSSGSFYFFWSFALKWILVGKNFSISSLFLNNLKTFNQLKLNTEKKNIVSFFSFSIASQISFFDFKEKNIFAKYWTFFFKNVFSRNKFIQNVSGISFSKHLINFQTGISIKPLLLFLLISKIFSKLLFNRRKKVYFIKNFFIRFQKNGTRDDVVSKVLLGILKKKSFLFFQDWFLNCGVINFTSLGGIFRKMGRKITTFKNFFQKKLCLINSPFVFIRFFMLANSIMKIVKGKKNAFFNKLFLFKVDNLNLKDVYRLKKDLTFFKKIFFIFKRLKKKKYLKHKIIIKDAFFNFLSEFEIKVLDYNLFAFFLESFSLKKKDDFFFINSKIFCSWQDSHSSLNFLRKNLFLYFKRGHHFKFSKKVQNILFEIMCDFSNKKRKKKKWQSNFRENQTILLSFFLDFGLKSGFLTRIFFFIIFEFILYRSYAHISKKRGIVSKFHYFYFFEIFLERFSVYQILIWIKFEIFSYYQRKFYCSIIETNLENKFKRFISLKQKTISKIKAETFDLFQKRKFILVSHFRSFLKIFKKKKMDLKLKTTFIFPLFVFKFLKKKKKKSSEFYNFLAIYFYLIRFYHSSHFLFSEIFDSFFKKLFLKKEKRNSNEFKKKILKNIVESFDLFRICMLKKQFCDLFWFNFPRTLALFIDFFSKSFFQYKIKKKKILIFFFESIPVLLSKISITSKNKFLVCLITDSVYIHTIRRIKRFKKKIDVFFLKSSLFKKMNTDFMFCDDYRLFFFSQRTKTNLFFSYA